MSNNTFCRHLRTKNRHVFHQPLKAPVVDALTVRVLVDSRYERFLPRMAHPHVKIEHVGRITGRPESTFACKGGCRCT